MPDDANRVVLGAIHNARDFSTLKAGNASTGGRSFSRLFLAPIQHLKNFVSPARCPLCAVGKSDFKRLAKIISLLPAGRKVWLQDVREIVGGSDKDVSRDLHLLQHGLKLPITRTRRGGILLAAPVHLCKRCAQKAKEFCQPAGNDFMRDRSGEEYQHNQAARRTESAAPPFPS